MKPASAVESILELDAKWTGDFDDMVERQKIRVLVPYSKTLFFLDGARQAGITYEGMETFEKWLNKEFNKKQLKIHVVMIPTPSEDVLSGILEGRGDIAVGNITITPERLKIVDFSDPFAKGVREIVVAAKGTSNLKELEDRRG